MKTSVDESETTRTYVSPQPHGEGQISQTATPMFTHEDIARRAYEIYVKRGRRQGQSQYDWMQAEKELQNERLAAATPQRQSLHSRIDSLKSDFERRSGQR